MTLLRGISLALWPLVAMKDEPFTRRADARLQWALIRQGHPPLPERLFWASGLVNVIVLGQPAAFFKIESRVVSKGLLKVTQKIASFPSFLAPNLPLFLLYQLEFILLILPSMESFLQV